LRSAWHYDTLRILSLGALIILTSALVLLLHGNQAAAPPRAVLRHQEPVAASGRTGGAAPLATPSRGGVEGWVASLRTALGPCVASVAALDGALGRRAVTTVRLAAADATAACAVGTVELAAVRQHVPAGLRDDVLAQGALRADSGVLAAAHDEARALVAVPDRGLQGAGLSAARVALKDVSQRAQEADALLASVSAGAGP
jgi:hypothetical protein